MTFQPDNPDVAAIVRGDHADPFAVLGPHGGGEAEPLSIRTFAPHASRVEVVDAGSGASLAQARFQAASATCATGCASQSGAASQRSKTHIVFKRFSASSTSI